MPERVLPASASVTDMIIGSRISACFIACITPKAAALALRASKQVSIIMMSAPPLMRLKAWILTVSARESKSADVSPSVDAIVRDFPDGPMLPATQTVRSGLALIKSSALLRAIAAASNAISPEMLSMP